MTTTLTKQEKNNVQKALGNMASSLNQTVAKLYLANPYDGQWTDTGVWGAVVICIDRTPPKSNFIKIFDLNTFTVRFSQELYENMSYQQAHARFHTFEIDNGLVGLSFVDAEEAEGFLGAVRRMIPVPGMSSTTTASVPAKKQAKGGFFSRLFGGKKDDHAEIGLPTNFVHKSHIGYDVEKGFESTDLPPEWKAIMKNAGIKKRDLKNPETAKIIYETLQEEFGGKAPEPPIAVPHHPYGFSAAPQPSSPSNHPLPTPPVPPPARALPPTPVAPPMAPPIQAPPAPPMAPPAPSFVPDSPPTAPTAPPPTPPIAPDMSTMETKANPTADLHAAIRGGISLRKVAKPNQKDALPDVSQLNQQEQTTLTSVLQIAMMKRLKSLQGGQTRSSVSEMTTMDSVNVEEDEWSD